MSPRFLLAIAVLLAAKTSAWAQESPEKLLSPGTQFFVKWDGVSAHANAYKNSALGAIMAGPTGDTLRNLVARAPKLLGANLLAEPLLDGKSPTELKAVHADLKNAEKLLDLILDKGIIVTAEVNEPRPTLGGIGKALGGLLNGNAPAPDSLLPDARLLIVVPDVGDKSEVFFGSLRLLHRNLGANVVPLPATIRRQGFSNLSADKGGSFRVAWWLEGKHFVLYAGSAPVETVVKGMSENAAKGGLTNNPLYHRCLRTGEFESVARGFVDSAKIIGLAKNLAAPFIPGLSEKLDTIGVGNLQAIVFSSGFNGKESRALFEFDLPGKRQGLAKIIKAKPIALEDLPPLPPDVSRFSMLRIDPTGFYDAGLVGADLLFGGASLGVEEEGKSPVEIARLRKVYLERELNKFVGLNVKEDLLPYLGDKIVMFQSPSEGLSVFGTVLCISVKDAAKVQAATDRLQRGLEAYAASPLKIRRKVLRGTEIREVYSRGFGVITPTYAVVGDWLVIAGNPQPVQGLVLRHKGELEKWKPDADTAARLAKMPADSIGLQYCRPQSVVQNLCCIGPLALGTLSRFNRGDSTEFDPLDIGLIPNAHEFSRHLFPNLTYTRDDGKTVRIEVNDSFSLPVEFIGFESAAFALLTVFAGF